MILSEQERQNVIRSCERIEELYAQQQRSLQNLIKIFDNLANGRDPADGLEDGTSHSQGA